MLSRFLSLSLFILSTLSCTKTADASVFKGKYNKNGKVVDYKIIYSPHDKTIFAENEREETECRKKLTHKEYGDVHFLRQKCLISK